MKTENNSTANIEALILELTNDSAKLHRFVHNEELLALLSDDTMLALINAIIEKLINHNPQVDFGLAKALRQKLYQATDIDWNECEITADELEVLLIEHGVSWQSGIDTLNHVDKSHHWKRVYDEGGYFIKLIPSFRMHVYEYIQTSGFPSGKERLSDFDLFDVVGLTLEIQDEEDKQYCLDPHRINLLFAHKTAIWRSFRWLGANLPLRKTKAPYGHDLKHLIEAMTFNYTPKIAVILGAQFIGCLKKDSYPYRRLRNDVYFPAMDLDEMTDHYLSAVSTLEKTHGVKVYYSGEILDQIETLKARR